jgi:hypothetical protein
VAKLLVSSRCFGIGDRGDVALLPMVDMLNHRRAPHVCLGRSGATDDEAASGGAEGGGGGAGFTLSLVVPLDAGEEVCSTYDKACVRQACSWLLNYG